MLKVLFISLFALVFLNGCKHYDASLLLQSQNNHYDDHQPPVHAPAHGRRAMHAYHYYPEADFYYDSARRTYFYLNLNGNWAFSVNLPTRYRSYLNTKHVQIEMDSDRPYSKYNDHKRKYKKKKKYKREQKRDKREYKRDRREDKREYKRELKQDKREYKREKKKDRREYKREKKKDNREYKRENKKDKRGKNKYNKYEDD